MIHAARPLRRSPAARGFFSSFYEWSIANYPARPLHTSNTITRLGKTKSTRRKNVIHTLETQAPGRQFTSSSRRELDVGAAKNAKDFAAPQGSRPSKAKADVRTGVIAAEELHSGSASHSQRNNAVLDSNSKPNSNTPTSLLSPEPPLSTKLRSIMRVMPHSVVVATSTSPDEPPSTLKSQSKGESEEATIASQGSPRGMTVSSFTTLTLTPEPIVTFNIRRPSSTLDAIIASRRFNIHILAANDAGVRIAHAFSRGNVKATAPPAIATDGTAIMDVQEIFSQHSILSGGWEKDKLAPPSIVKDGIVRVLKCEVWNDAPEQGLATVGDHVLIFGKVVEIDESQLRLPSDSGLFYVGGQYRSIDQLLTAT